MMKHLSTFNQYLKYYSSILIQSYHFFLIIKTINHSLLNVSDHTLINMLRPERLALHPKQEDLSLIPGNKERTNSHKLYFEFSMNAKDVHAHIQKCNEIVQDVLQENKYTMLLYSLAYIPRPLSHVRKY